MSGSDALHDNPLLIHPVGLLHYWLREAVVRSDPLLHYAEYPLLNKGFAGTKRQIRIQDPNTENSAGGVMASYEGPPQFMSSLEYAKAELDKQTEIAVRAIEFAERAAEGVHAALRFGLGNRGGEVETEVRRILSEIEPMARCIKFEARDEGRCRHWNELRHRLEEIEKNQLARRGKRDHIYFHYRWFSAAVHGSPYSVVECIEWTPNGWRAKHQPEPQPSAPLEVAAGCLVEVCILACHDLGLPLQSQLQVVRNTIL